MLKNSGQSAERDNWTLAHELGHLLLHRHIPNVETDNTFNDEADSFARSFLLPRQEFVRAVGGRCTMELLLALKSSYRVSIQALVRSMHQYELITDSQYQFAFKRLTQKNMRRVEPGDRPSQSSKKLVSFADSAAQSFSSLERFCFDVLRVSTDLACEIAPPLSGFSILQSFYI